MLDIYVLSLSLGGLLLFAVIHTIVFRFIDSRAVILWIQRLFLAVLLTLLFTWILLFLFMTDRIPDEKILIVAILLSVMQYGLFTTLYLWVFGILESSLRIRILSEIAYEGKSGLEKTVLLKKYNRDVIVKRRLNRLLASGDLLFDGNWYRISKRRSLFWIPALYFRFFWKLFHV